MNNQKALNLSTKVEADQTANQEATPIAPVQITIPSSLPLPTDDPNFDPDWDWTLNEPQNLFASTQNGLQLFENVSLPYYADSGPAANDFNSDVSGVRDILPQDGWVLLFRDFGTPERGIAFPRFILYNRFRGLLRLFYFNPHFPAVFTYGVVTLQKQSGSDAFGLLTFLDEENSTLSDFDPERKEVFMGRLEPVTWNYADFLVVGYDPNLPDDARFEFEITGVQESDISLEGTLSLNQVLNRKNLIVSKSGEGEALLSGDGIASAFKSLGALKKAVKAIAKDASLGDVAGLISAGIGLFKLFAGGSKPEHPQVLLHFKGEIKLSGTIRLQGAIGSFLLRIPGARHLGSTDLPFYDKPLGIFNLRTHPIFDVKVFRKTTRCRYTDEFGSQSIKVNRPFRYECDLRTPDVILNPDAGFSALVEEAVVQHNGTLEFARAGVSDGYFTLGQTPTIILENLKTKCEPEPVGPKIEERSLAIRLTITPLETVPEFTPVTFVKLYKKTGFYPGDYYLLP
jgi:hypothetical protein